MQKIKKYANEIFIDGLSGMALGLFSTLIIGTIIAQAGSLIGGTIGAYLIAVSNVAKTVTGAGIGVGVASKFKEGPLVTVAAAVTGMIGAFPSVTDMEAYGLGKPGEPLGAFIAAMVAIKIGHLAAGKTKIDILVTPLVSILSGAVVGIIAGPPISAFMKWLGALVNFNVEMHPVLGGIIVSVLMGMILTLPISSAAIGLSMNISGLAAGAATIGCCCNMVGFAVASYRENKVGGLIAQGVGTSMLQVPNIVKKPIIWLPAIVSSAVLGPVGSAVFRMTSTPVGSGMGSAGFVGQIAAYGSMTEGGMTGGMALALILLMHFVLPAALTLAVSELMRKKGLIAQGDMSLNV
ncbi:MAG: PTS sugar transporter subunit IIC [Lachnoclostridium sp.]|nr:PTS sugar transporter subunit IIC [Lachnospira sp.]MCM1247974.1 PTS sugar transporter subunit IIC [Lachnoclostridium sp.]MCM1535587.1 PTS sugar transporter subunit IIC [Clostridium sp.]